MVKLLAAAVAGVLVAAGSVVAAPARDPLDPGVVTPRYGTWGFDTAGQDPSIKPGDDFFRYANGAWLKRVEIPADRVRFGAFDVLSQLSENRVRAILEAAAASSEAPTTPRGKIGAFYRAYMDADRVEARGDAPLQADLARVKAATTREALASLMGEPGGFFASVFEVDVRPDAKQPDRYAVVLATGGLGLPDKDYYLKDTPRFVEVRAKYRSYISQMLTLARWPEPQTSADAILAFETRLAAATWDRAERRDRDRTYNPTSPAALAQTAPGFDFRRFLAASDLGEEARLILSDASAFKTKAAIVGETPVPVLQAWMAFNAADAAAPCLPDRFVQARFAFRRRELSGQPELQPRWKRAVAATDDALGEAVGQIYVAQYFPASAKAQMLDLVANLKTAFAGRIDRLDWMTPQTKAQAQAKLARFNVKIAYPDVWRDYSRLRVSSSDLYGDVVRAGIFEWNRQTRRLHQPVDRKEWGMSPQTVNAYYSPTMNEIVFPAAILQPPFFDPQADPAVNYGGVGGVIGHEMSHGFDDQGRKSDGAGVLADWWTPVDAAQFKARTDRLGAQYSAFEILPGEHINGANTMGENIGDMGGITLALDAYHASLNGRPAPVIDGLTGDQRLFLAWAQVWRGKTRDAALVQQLHTDPHSPNEARVNAVVRNVDAWYPAFGVKPGDKLYLSPADRVRIW